MPPTPSAFPATPAVLTPLNSSMGSPMDDDEEDQRLMHPHRPPIPAADNNLVDHLLHVARSNRGDKKKKAKIKELQSMNIATFMASLVHSNDIIDLAPLLKPILHILHPSQCHGNPSAYDVLSAIPWSCLAKFEGSESAFENAMKSTPCSQSSFPVNSEWASKLLMLLFVAVDIQKSADENTYKECVQQLAKLLVKPISPQQVRHNPQLRIPTKPRTCRSLGHVHR